MRNYNQSENENIIQPHIEKINSAKVLFKGDEFENFSFSNIKSNADLYFHKMWVYLAKLQKEQDNRQFDFPIDGVDRQINLVKLQSLLQDHSFESFDWRKFDESKLSLKLNIKYDVNQSIYIRNIRFKLYLITPDMKKFNVSEAPLIKYDNEPEEIKLNPGLYHPKYEYKLDFDIAPESLSQILSGKAWLGLAASNIDIETSRGRIEFKDLVHSEYNSFRTWIKNDNNFIYSGGKSVSQVMKKIDPKIELRSNGDIESFLGKRNSKHKNWTVISNKKISYVTYLSDDELQSFDNKFSIIDDWKEWSGKAIVEASGVVHSTSLLKSVQTLQSKIDDPIECSRWTRFDKGECTTKDLSCDVTVQGEKNEYKRNLKPDDIGISSYIIMGDFFLGYLDELNEIKIPENKFSSQKIGVISIGDCPSQSERGFKLPGFSPLYQMKNIGLFYDISLVVKKPAPFQLWL